MTGQEARDDSLANLAEEGRLLASRREDLIARGVDPYDLAIPLHPEAPQGARDDEREALAGAVMTAMGCDQHEDQGDCATCDSSIVSCSHPLFLYCDTHDEDAELGEPCPAAVKVVDAVLAMRKHPEPEITDAVRSHWQVIRGAQTDMLNGRPDMDALEEIALASAALDQLLGASGPWVPVGEGEQG